MSVPELPDVSDEVLASINPVTFVVQGKKVEKTVLGWLSYFDDHLATILREIVNLQLMPNRSAQQEKELGRWRECRRKVTEERNVLVGMIANETDPTLPKDV